MNKIIQQYALEQHITTDTYGFDLYKARHIETKQFFTVKCMSCANFNNAESYQDIVHHEIKLLKKVQHVNIIKFVRILKTSNNIYLVFEYCPGGSLYNRIKSSRISESQQNNFMKQITLGVKELHKHGILHLNLNPRNILIGSGNNLKIVNMTLSKTIADPYPIIPNNHIGEYIQAIKNLEYCAPEIKNQKEGWAGAATHKSDIFSLGILFYFILTTKTQSVDNILGINLGSSHDPTLEAINSMVNKDPLKRPELTQIKMSASNRSPAKTLRINSMGSNSNLLGLKGIGDDIDSNKQRSIRNGGGSPLLKRSPSQHSSISHVASLLNIPSKLQREEVQSHRGPLIDNSPQASSHGSSFNIMKTISKERNKYAFLTVVSNTIYTLDINAYSGKLALLLLKKAKLKSLHLVVLANKDKLLKSAGEDFVVLAKLVSSEEAEISQTYKQMKDFVLNKEKKITSDRAFDLEMKDDSAINQKYLKNLVKDYIKAAVSKINVKDESKTTQKFILHLHNVADAENIDNFFSEYISDSVVKLEEQTYFTQLETYNSMTLFKYLLDKGY